MGTQTKVGTADCPQCEKEVDVVMIDCGIGAYEYWGAKGVDTDLRPSCSICQEELDSQDVFWDDLDDEVDDYPEDDWREER